MTLIGPEKNGAPGDAERDPRLDRAYREAGRELPPAHLDAAILAAARREAGARPRRRSSKLRRWRVPVSIAAVVVLSVSLVTLVREEGGQKLMQVEPRRPPPALPREAAPPPAPRPGQADAQPALSPIPAPVTAPVPSRPASRDDAPAHASGELGKFAGRERAEAVAPRSEGAGTAATPEPPSKPAPQPLLAVPRGAGERRAAPPAASALEKGAASPPPSVAVSRSAQPSASGPAPVPDRSRVRAQTAGSASDRSDRLPIWRGFENEPPQKWLERIEEFKRQERAAEAADMLAEFKRRFPGHPLPPGLR